MSTAKLDLVVTPANFKSAYEGCIYSDKHKINVNLIQDVYVILFTDDEFKNVNPVEILRDIKNLMQSNIKETEIIFTIIYDGRNNLDQKTLLGLLKIDSDLSAKPRSLYPLIYNPSDQLVEIAQKVVYNNHMNESRAVSRPNYKEEKEKYEQQMDDDEFMKAFYGIDLPKGKKKYKSKSGKKRFNYASSKVLKASSRPKKSYNRHGVIICKNKKAIKKDEETIKDFLKDFIPGNSSFKKNLRKDLLKRWMAMYVITKKRANKMQKNFKKSLNKVSKHEKTEQIIDFTKKMISIPIDSWNDPNR